MMRTITNKYLLVGFIALLGAIPFGCNLNDPSNAPELPRSLMQNLRYGIKVSDTNSNYIFSDNYPHKLDLNDTTLRNRIGDKAVIVLFTINNLPIDYKYHLKIIKNDSPTPVTMATAISRKDSAWTQLEYYGPTWYSSGNDYKNNYKIYIQDSLVFQDSVELITHKR